MRFGGKTSCRLENRGSYSCAGCDHISVDDSVDGVSFALKIWLYTGFTWDKFDFKFLENCRTANMKCLYLQTSWCILDFLVCLSQVHANLPVGTYQVAFRITYIDIGYLGFIANILLVQGLCLDLGKSCIDNKTLPSVISFRKFCSSEPL